jgi:hypothetical protein
VRNHPARWMEMRETTPPFGHPSKEGNKKSGVRDGLRKFPSRGGVDGVAGRGGLR